MNVTVVLAAALSLAFSSMYQNPVVNSDRPDPGVLPVMYNGTWFVATTSGDAPDAFPIMT